MNVLITGAQFDNKGAQSLLFTTINQLRNKYKEVEIYYLPLDDYRKYSEEVYRFHPVYCGEAAFKYEEGGLQRYIYLCKQLVKSILKNDVSIKEVKYLHQILPRIDVWFDISGYQLSSKWPLKINIRFLNYIELANKYSIPIILMPQSFGPFEYGNNQKKIIDLITTILRKADLIFAREREGYNNLRSLVIENIKYSTDIVLQGDSIEWENIWNCKPTFSYPTLKSNNNVGIVPNFQTFVHKSRKTNLRVYKEIISVLLKMNKNIYIFRHSSDLEACEQIYNLYKDDNHVCLIKDEMNSLEFGMFVKQFDYIIASRYHAIIHAYKENVPVIIIGWARKYIELAELFNQTRYVFDISDMSDKCTNILLEKIKYMDNNCNDEKKEIQIKIKTIKANSCFEICWKIIDNRRGRYEN
jgi:polysaccharide pyruvyl transferase WcaK-like protein